MYNWSIYDGFLLVDYQNDFQDILGAALPVPGARAIQEDINRYMYSFRRRALSRCWHPKGHCSTHEKGGIHPEHCVQWTWGAKYPETLYVPEDAKHFSKGRDLNHEEYSAWAQAEKWVLENNIQHLYIAGVATEYCVKATALDAVKSGVQTFVFTDGIAGVNALNAHRAIEEMADNGVALL